MSDKFPGGLITTGAPAGFSVAFDGTGDYLTWSGSTVGAGVFTFECWFYANNFSASQSLFGPNGTTNGGFGFNVASSTSISIDRYGVSADNFTVPTMSTNTWYHIAVVRNSSNATTVFLNGVRSSTGTTTIAYTFGNVGAIGYTSSAVNRYFNGYISNARYVAAAVYDPTATTINLPTQLFPIASTVLLACQSPTLVDNSTNNFTITANGNATVSNFTPFAGYKGFNPALGAAAPGVWTLNEASYYQGNRQWPIYDPFFNRTTLMLHGNGTNGAQNNTFLDSSTNNFAITRNGNTTQGTFTPFSQTGWSTFFNGSSIINVASNAAFNLSSGTWTFEGFFYLVSTPAKACRAIMIGTNNNLNSYVVLNINTNLTISCGVPATGTGVGSGSSTLPLNQWSHVAVVMNNSVGSIYINGAIVGTQSGCTQMNNTSAALAIGQDSSEVSVNAIFNGYMSNLRLVKGVALYSGNGFTVPTSPLTAVAGTSLLTCQDNRFVDDSANNLTLTLSGTGTSVQAFSPFVPTVTTPTTYSNYFDGTGDYLTLSSNTAFAFGTGDFTIEGWVYNNNASTGRFVLYATNSIGTSGSLAIFQESLSLIYFRIDGGNDLTTTAPSINAWNHIAVTRASGTVRIFINGILSTSATRAQDITQNTPYIGDFTTGGYSLSGCLSNLRVLKGTALYTAAFTPPTAPLTAITNTSLLTCQSSTFIDNSGNALPITAGGNVRPVASPTPFPALVDQTTLNTAYSTSLIGGSGYFDGTGDFLSLTTTAALTLGTNSFTVEYFYYVPDTVGGQGRISWGAAGSPNIYLGTGALVTYTNFATSVLLTSSIACQVNAWNHIAIVRNSGTTTIYINGVSGGSVADTTNWSIGSGTFRVMSSQGSDYSSGYVSGVRIVNGTAVYTSAFTPPTTPLTAITNTALLLNFTNAGIIDNTAKNVLETVSSAAISTTQAKWGSTSMNFPATTSSYLKGAISQNTKFPAAFTVEAWIYPNQVSARADIFCTPTASSSGTGIYWYVSSTAKLTLDKGGANLATSTISIVASAWTHVAVTRTAAGAITLWINGVASGTGSDTTNFSDGNLFVGTEFALTNFWNGFIADLRVTQGVARYTTNFTPPTSQLQDQ